MTKDHSPEGSRASVLNKVNIIAYVISGIAILGMTIYLTRSCSSVEPETEEVMDELYEEADSIFQPVPTRVPEAIRLHEETQELVRQKYEQDLEYASDDMRTWSDTVLHKYITDRLQKIDTVSKAIEVRDRLRGYDSSDGVH